MESRKCINCGAKDHVVKQCHEPITSYGVIAFTRNRHIRHGNIYNRRRATCASHASKPFYSHVPASTRYFLIQRKDTIAYIDFVRGKYNDANLATMFAEMTCQERDQLRNWSFHRIWDTLWVNHSSRCFIYEKERAHTRFQRVNIAQYLDSIPCGYREPEYGFPKGRASYNETPLETAVREFVEESGYTMSEFAIVPMGPFVEEFFGTNGIAYRHVYYVAEILTDRPPAIQEHMYQQSGEVQNVGFWNYEQCLDLFRVYDDAKRKCLATVHFALTAFLSKQQNLAIPQSSSSTSHGNTPHYSARPRYSRPEICSGIASV